MTRSFDILGNIAIVHFPRETKQSEKKKFAEKILGQNKTIKTILEKKGKIHGRLRKISTRYLAGEKTKEVLYRENGCVFRFDVDETYFSPRLSNERKEIAQRIKKGENVLVMFAGVSPFSIVIAKNSDAKKVFSNEINRKANKYAELNIELNKLKNKIELVPGDIKKVAKKISMRYSSDCTKRYRPSVFRGRSTRKIKGFPRFDVIVMPRPQLKETFLKEAFMLSKKNTRVYYYDFCKENETDLIIAKIQKQAGQFRRKIKILKIKRAGEIAPYKIRVRVDFKILD